VRTNKALHPTTLPSLRSGNAAGEIGRWADFPENVKKKPFRNVGEFNSG